MESDPVALGVDDDPEGASFVDMARAAMPAPPGRHRRLKWLAAVLALLLVAAGLGAVLSTVKLSAHPRSTRRLASSNHPRLAGGATTMNRKAGSQTPGSPAPNAATGAAPVRTAAASGPGQPLSPLMPGGSVDGKPQSPNSQAPRPEAP
ncbi:MAG: hypothetical protein J2P57_10410, partial [Acidimicrobiaceae bacterium]|nr:hypothetical protein [Acidimicrobiaceae bacterium]